MRLSFSLAAVLCVLCVLACTSLSVSGTDHDPDHDYRIAPLGDGSLYKRLAHEWWTWLVAHARVRDPSTPDSLLPPAFLVNNGDVDCLDGLQHTSDRDVSTRGFGCGAAAEIDMTWDGSRF
jgi:hypothetical protein